ncbi:MAG: hypothetical protein ABII80_02105 [bacterium]
MPKKTTKKKVSRSTKVSASKKEMILRNQFFGMLLIALAIGALIVLVRYLVVTLVMPADVYQIEPSMLVPGMK